MIALTVTFCISIHSNALLRSNPLLLEKGLRAMIKIPKCRMFLDFDVKRLVFVLQTRMLSHSCTSSESLVHQRNLGLGSNLNCGV